MINIADISVLDYHPPMNISMPLAILTYTLVILSITWARLNARAGKINIRNISMLGLPRPL